MTHSSPSSTAVVLSDARSEPEFGLGEALAPAHRAVEDLRQEVLLLLLGAVHEDRRADERVTEEVGAHRRLGPGELLGEHDALDRGEPLAAVLLGHVAQIQPPSNSFWVHSSFHAFFSSARHLEALVEPAVGQVLLEPGTDLDAERLGLGGVVRSMPAFLTDRSPFHLEEELGADDCIHGEKGCTSCTRACPRFRLWEGQADEHLFARTRAEDEVAGIYSDIMLTRASDDMVHQMGQDGGLVSAILIWAMEHDYIDASLVSFLEGDGLVEGRPVSPPTATRSSPPPAAATPTRPTRWPSTRRSRPATPASPWSA
jgi:hypothetical protein